MKYWWCLLVVAGCSHGGGGSKGADHPTELGSTGHLSAEKIKRAVQGHFGIFRQCYAHAHSPKRAGTVSVRFVIDRDGHVSLSELDESTLDDDVSNCVVDGFRKIRFPRPEGGVVTVVYPIKFSPG